MILQALYEYYQRKTTHTDPSQHLPRFGFEEKEIPFIIELTAEGKYIGITDTRQGAGKKKTAQRYLVPQSVKRSSGVAANLLWDTAEYVLGVSKKDNQKRIAEQHSAFRQRLAALPAARIDKGLLAIENFYGAGGASLLAESPYWAEILEVNPNITFRIFNEGLVCSRPGIFAGLGDETSETSTASVCLVTGQQAQIERLHTAIKGVWGAQSAGANLISFNLDAFTSFNKSQGENAPVSPEAAFAYTTALNHLLDRHSRQRIQVGDASTVFWAQKDGLETEENFAAFFGDTDNPDERSEKIHRLLAAVHNGKFDGGQGKDRFYVLGLSPNVARISVRFWHATSIEEISIRVCQWFDDIKMVHAPHEPEYPTLFYLLTACAALHKAENIPPNLGGDIMRAILSGGPYPAAWLNLAVIRCRAEQKVSYPRAAIIKACLNRLYRSRKDCTLTQEFSEMLDIENTSPAYRLGRLFATLEKIQEEASPGLNATIRERYYGAASSTPVSVFTTLLRLKNHHLAKLENRGRAVNFEQLIGEIISGLNDFPKRLNLPEQGKFALGYYHQRQDFFRKIKPGSSTEGENA